MLIHGPTWASLGFGSLLWPFSQATGTTEHGRRCLCNVSVACLIVWVCFLIVPFSGCSLVVGSLWNVSVCVLWVCVGSWRLARDGQRGPKRPIEAHISQEKAREAQVGPSRSREAHRGPDKQREGWGRLDMPREAQEGPEKPRERLFYGCVSVAWEIGQRRPERPKEAHRGSYKPRKGKRGPGRSK